MIASAGAIVFGDEVICPEDDNGTVEGDNGIAAKDSSGTGVGKENVATMDDSPPTGINVGDLLTFGRADGIFVGRRL